MSAIHGRIAAFAIGVILAGTAVASAKPHPMKHTAPGLGPVVQDALGGTIFGWDINQNGSDGLLSETVFENRPPYFLNAIETFDEPSAKIVKVVRTTRTEGNGPLPFVYAIAGNDVGIIDDQYYFVKNSQIVRDDKFLEMSPVSGNKITGSSKPPHNLGMVPSFMTNNEASSSQSLMEFGSGSQGAPIARMFVYDVARDVWGSPFNWPPNNVAISGLPNGYLLYAAEDTKDNVAVVSFQTYPYLQQDPGWFDEFDAKTGVLLRLFHGLGAGFSNGMAIDSTTGILCSTAQDMSVGFYNVSTGKGFIVQIPVYHGGGPLTNGAAVAVDQVNHLFLVAQLNSTFDPNGGSTVIVYDEQGNLIEAINGFNFLNRFSPVVVHIAVNGTTREGFVPAPNGGELQSFTY